MPQVSLTGMHGPFLEFALKSADMQLATNSQLPTFKAIHQNATQHFAMYIPSPYAYVLYAM